MRIAIVDKNSSSENYSKFFDFDYDLYHLSSVKKDKILKKDIDIEIDEDLYDYIITVGADACKHIAKVTSVTTHQGTIINEKYIPLTNPNMLSFKPQAAPDFYKAIDNIKKYISGEVTAIHEINIKGINSEQEALEYITSLIDNPNIKIISLDTETSSLYPRNGFLLGISISHENYQGVYIDADCISETIAKLLQLLVSTKTIIFHNAKFDISVLKFNLNLNIENFHDTMLQHYILDETKNTHGLKDLAIKFTDLGNYDNELELYKEKICKEQGIKKSDFTYDLIPFNIMYIYAACDAAATYLLHNRFYSIIENNNHLKFVYDNILIEGTKLFVDVEDNGIPLSKEKLLEADKFLIERERDLVEKLYTFTEIKEWEEENKKVFNYNSPIQIRNLLFNKLKLKPTGIKTTTGEHSANEEALTILSKNHKLPGLLLELRKSAKLRNTYITKLLVGIDADGRIRTNFNLHTTTSGRTSSSGRLNAQQFPRNKMIKRCISANPNHKIVSHDLSTAEMYIAAALSGDKNLQQVFISRVDYHGYMAVNKFGLDCSPNEVKDLYPDLRQSAKTISFEILYKLNYNEPALEKFPRLKEWLKQQEFYIRDHAHIYSAFGRKRRLPNVKSSSRQIAEHEIRSGINFLVQSVASDLNIRAAIKMNNYIKSVNLDAKIFMLVHDSIVAEVADSDLVHYCSKMKEFMQEDMGVSIKNCPIGVDIDIGEDYSFSK